MATNDKLPHMEAASPIKTASSDGKQSIDIQVDGETYTIDAAAEKRLVWKFDLRILPILAVMYLFNALDKSNLGNAKTAGLENDLGMKGTNQYNTILSIFFVPYVLTAPFLAILGKKYGPSRVLPAMMVTFGTMTLLVVTVKNFAGLFVLRWFLGMAESESRTETAQLQGSPANKVIFERRLLPSGNLLPNAILPPRRARPPTCNLLRGFQHRRRVWRIAGFRHFPDPRGLAGKLALSLCSRGQPDDLHGDSGLHLLAVLGGTCEVLDRG